MQCNNCGNEVEASARFCPKCGNRLPEIINFENKQTFNAPGCLLKTIFIVIMFFVVCVALALFAIALPWMILIGFAIIAISTIAFFFS
ncbi:MAG: zinc-ribbon domain [Pseudomonadota bacterium]|jgi:uncharacterized membrane protein YvbJ